MSCAQGDMLEPYARSVILKMNIGDRITLLPVVLHARSAVN